jgi:hypothetical protein
MPTKGVRSPTSHRTPEQIKQHYKDYQGTPAQIANRSERNSARAEMAKKGLVHKGDGKDVDHKNPIRSGGGNSPGNLRVIPKGRNRGWRDGV